MLKQHHGAALLAALILSGCATSRTAQTHKYEAETQRDSAGVTLSTTTAKATTTTASTATAGTTTTTASHAAVLDSAAEVEVTTVATTYDTAGRAVVVRTEKRTNKSRRSNTDLTTNGDISRWSKDTTTTTTGATTTAKSEAQTHTKSTEKAKEKAVTTTGRPWYFWPVRAGIVLAVAAVLWALWPIVSPVFGWFLLLFKRRDKSKNGA